MFKKKGVILVALSIHPRDRPPTVDVWRQLLCRQPITRLPHSPWNTFWRDNGWLIVLAALLSALVLYLTFVAH